MEANVKLLKKKRIAHMCGKMSKSNFDEPKLPPDDFVYNIMKDMDSNNVISYQQSQEVRSKKMKSLPCNEGERQMNSTTEDGYYNKQTKKGLPKKSFPLMKKCQTSLKYLKKNRCIPKPRAHVGFVPKPQVKPVCYTEPKPSISENQNSRKAVKPKKMQSKAYSKILQSNYIQNKISEPTNCEKNKSGSFAAHEVPCHLSSTDDDDAAFESFVQKAIEENDESTDSDSRLVIHRKKSRNKLKQKKIKRRRKSFSDDENKKHTPKITSIPLSDSSDNESKDAQEQINQSLKRKTDSPQGVQKRVCKDALESYNSESLSEPTTDHCNNYSSSDEDSSVHATTLNNETKVDSNVNLDFSNVNLDSYTKLSNHVTEHPLVHNTSSDSAVLQHISESEAADDLVNTENSESNDLLSCYSEITDNVPKYEVPCYVQLKRDPILDKKALTFCLKSTSSEDDCILISGDSDVDEVSTTSHSTPSSALEKTRTPFGLLENLSNKREEIQNSNSTNIQSCEDADMDDCVIMCEMPKAVLKNIEKSNEESKSLSSESLSSTAKSTLTNSNTQNFQAISDTDEFANRENTKPDTVNNFSEIKNEELLNSEKTADSIPGQEDESKNIDEFNVQIVAVTSLVESSPNSFETNTSELNEIEVIDLSDDDVNENSEVVREIAIKDHSVQDDKAIQPNSTEVNPSEHDNLNYDSMTSEHRIQSSCENSTAKQNLPDPKILEILSTINFDCIKEVINRTKVVDTSKSSEVEVISDVSPTLPGFENKVENAISTNIEAFEKRSVDEGKTVLVTDMNTKLTSNNSCIKENISSELSSQSKTFQLVNAEGTVHNSDQENKALLKQNQDNSLYNCTKTNAVHSYTSICNNLKTTEVPKNSIPNKKRQLNSQTLTEAVPPKAKISKEIDASVPKTVNALKHKDIVVAKCEKVNIKETIKCEIPESPSDDLDALASTFIQDLNPPNNKVLSLLNLYKAEYSKYMQIKNTEVNVSAGLKLLHENQVKKLLHLRSSIKNLVKHDACFYKVNQEEAKASIVKKEIKSKVEVKAVSSPKSKVEAVSNPMSKVEVKAVSNPMSKVEVKAVSNPMSKVEVKAVSNPMSKVEVKAVSSPASTSKEREDTKHFKAETKQLLNIDSAGTSREKMLKMMMNFKCAECGKPATARCQGCAEVFYCSPKCGELSWKQSHYAVCKR